MVKYLEVRPQNSIILLEDSGGGSVPNSIGSKLVVATESCVVIGCRAESDGSTKITIGTDGEVALQSLPIFEGRLSTPSKVLILSTVDGTRLFERSVPQSFTNLRVWANDPNEPDEIVVGITG
jgi:hypothetical protein